jgi:lycopene cyclase domain-containing protein
VRHASYLAVLGFILLATGWLEISLRTRVYARWRRLAASVLPVATVFVAWDLYAIARGHWTFDPGRTSGLRLPGDLPIEELAFFVVVPIASILTLEAVRSVRGWRVGDEVDRLTPDQPPPGGPIPDDAPTDRRP